MTDLINTPSQSETAEDKTPGAETSVAELYERCIKAFRLLPAISGADPSRAVRLDDADTTRVDHGYERLNTWGELSKANLRVGAPDSLDDTLRNNVNIKAPVTSTLLRLEEVLRQGWFSRFRTCYFLSANPNSPAPFTGDRRGHKS